MKGRACLSIFVFLFLALHGAGLAPAVRAEGPEAPRQLPHVPLATGAEASPEANSPTAEGGVALNRAWVLICAFVIFFMQTGFAMVETGLTRAKNAAHTMAMNVMIYCIGALGFWICGFAFLYGGVGDIPSLGLHLTTNRELSVSLFGKSFGLLGGHGFFLAGRGSELGLLAVFLFQLMFMDTAATIATGALAERWKFASFLIYGFFVSMVLYPVYGNWVWGHGWLAQLGVNCGLGHGHVDFAGSTVVHMVGGIAAFAGAWRIGPRLGKYRPNGMPNPLPAHNVPMYMAGTLMLAFGWFGFNAGSTLSATDPIVARIAANTALASAAGATASMGLMWYLYRKPDPSFMCNGMLAGLVAITASCAYVTPAAAVTIGIIAGFLVVGSCLFMERMLRVDDPVGAVSIHAAAGIWGALALGLFADGTYAPSEGFNGVPGKVTGLFYGDGSQLIAQLVGIVANIVWVFPVAYGFFALVGRLVGNRVSAQAELQGLDVPELGALGYITQDPKVPESRILAPSYVEPRAATVPPNGGKHFTVVIEGADVELLTGVWSDLCQIGDQPPPPEFRAVYPYMTTMQGNRFRFRGGDPLLVRDNLEKLLKNRMRDRPIRARLE